MEEEDGEEESLNEEERLVTELLRVGGAVRRTETVRVVTVTLLGKGTHLGPVKKSMSCVGRCVDDLILSTTI